MWSKGIIHLKPYKRPIYLRGFYFMFLVNYALLIFGVIIKAGLEIKKKEK